MKRIWLASGLLIGMGGLATNAAAVDPGYYLGISAGESKASDVKDFSNIPQNITGAKTDDTDTAWKVFGGYRFNEYIGVELGWTDMGEYTRRGQLLGVDVKSKAKVNGVTLAATGTWPLGSQFSVLGKIGAYNWKVDTNFGDDNGTDGFVGVGAEWSFAPDVALRAEWEWFNDVGNTDINLVTVGVTSHF